MLDLRLRHQDPSKEQIVSPLLMDISGRHYCKYLIDSMASTPAAQPLIFWFQLPQENLHQGSTCLEGPLGTTVTTSSICPHNLRQGVPAWSCSFISGCLILSCLIFHNYLNKFLFFFLFWNIQSGFCFLDCDKHLCLEILIQENYRVGQNVHLGFSYHLMGKSKQTFWRSQYSGLLLVKTQWINELYDFLL